MRKNMLSGEPLFVISDDKVESEEFSNSVLGLLKDPQIREDMKMAASTFGTVDAASRLADVVELMMKTKGPKRIENGQNTEENEEDTDFDKLEDNSAERETNENTQSAEDADEAKDTEGAEEGEKVSKKLEA